MDLLTFGKTGWGDELFYATLMTIAVSITAMLIGFIFSVIFTPLKLSNNKFLNFIANFYTTVIRGVPGTPLMTVSYTHLRAHET